MLRTELHSKDARQFFMFQYWHCTANGAHPIPVFRLVSAPVYWGDKTDHLQSLGGTRCENDIIFVAWCVAHVQYPLPFFWKGIIPIARTPQAAGHTSKIMCFCFPNDFKQQEGKNSKNWADKRSDLNRNVACCFDENMFEDKKQWVQMPQEEVWSPRRSRNGGQQRKCSYIWCQVRYTPQIEASLTTRCCCVQ